MSAGEVAGAEEGAKARVEGGVGEGDVAGCLAPNVNEPTAWEISWRIAREPPCSSSSSILALAPCAAAFNLALIWWPCYVFGLAQFEPEMNPLRPRRDPACCPAGCRVRMRVAPVVVVVVVVAN